MLHCSNRKFNVQIRSDGQLIIITLITVLVPRGAHLTGFNNDHHVIPPKASRTFCFLANWGGN